MARPRKVRRVCALPKVSKFGPVNPRRNNGDTVIMSVEQYEAIRLIDLEGLTQQESSELMGVGRSTLQRIYEIGRKNLADALINGKELIIQGGDYMVCEEIQDKQYCDRGICRRNSPGR